MMDSQTQRRRHGRARLAASARFVALPLAVLVMGCKGDEPPRREPPPPAAAPPPAACAGGGGTLADAQSAPFLPRVSGSFCLDPNGGDKAFGEGAPLPLDQICDLFDGECEIYKGYNVRRVLEARYVDGSGSAATIDIHLSKFGSTESAYAMFTKRIVGDGDPADEATPRWIEGGGVGALGVGNAYLWRGLYLAEITYNDASAAEAAVRAASERVLPPLVKEIGSKIPGETAPPPAAAALPKEALLPLGVRYITKDLLDIDGVGAGAFGYYREGDKRFRMTAIVRGDVDQAKDVLATLAKQPGATKEKGIGDGAVRFMHRGGKDSDGVAVEWLFARAGKTVLGIGDEVRVLRTGMTAEEVAKVSLPKDAKSDRLKKALPGSI
ncbi:MAG TPA: DUF6599 family protein [Polyangiaceae bacterium]|nr:DUF6599 family protein [Polyangiaceae bacterium]